MNKDYKEFLRYFCDEEDRTCQPHSKWGWCDPNNVWEFVKKEIITKTLIRILEKGNGEDDFKKIIQEEINKLKTPPRK